MYIHFHARTGGKATVHLLGFYPDSRFPGQGLASIDSRILSSNCLSRWICTNITGQLVVTGAWTMDSLMIALSLRSPWLEEPLGIPGCPGHLGNCLNAKTAWYSVNRQQRILSCQRSGGMVRVKTRLYVRNSILSRLSAAVRSRPPLVLDEFYFSAWLHHKMFHIQC